MEEIASDVPLPPNEAERLILNTLKVGIIYNLKKGIRKGSDDIEAEYDNIETVEAIRDALEEGGTEVELLEVNEDLPEKLRRSKIDIAFNIAEGMNGRGREAQIPALLNMLGIPFTGSDETTLCLALDKALTKRLASTYRIRTPKYTVIGKNNSLSHLGSLRYPVIVKPNAEGSSKGISDVSIVKNISELKELTKRNIEIYSSDMIAEEYIEGREFTVGIIGNGKEAHVFRPMEIVYTKETQESYHVYSYNVKQNYKNYVRYECPSCLDFEKENEMIKAATRIYNILDCRDFARVDFRLSEDNSIYFIEINPLPGLAPGYSDYPMLAEFNGVDYNTLVRSVLYEAVKRLGMRWNGGDVYNG